MKRKKRVCEMGAVVFRFGSSWMFGILIAGLLCAMTHSPAHAITVTGNMPLADAVDIATETDIVIQFSETINSETVDLKMFTVNGTASRSNEFVIEVSGSSITLDPEDELVPGETVTVTVNSGIEGMGGDSLEDSWKWSFTIIHGIIGTNPVSNAVVSSNTKITLNFSEDLIPETVKTSMFSIKGSNSESHGFTVAVSKALVSLMPEETFIIGETVTATAKTQGIQVKEDIKEGNVVVGEIIYNVKPEILQWQFDIAVKGTIHYIDSGQALGNSYSQGIALGYLNGDDHLDAFVANGMGLDDVPEKRVNKVWFNDGTGQFVESEQILDSLYSYSVTLGDLDGDGKVDAFVANGSGHEGVIGGPNKVWLNDGTGTFSDSEQTLFDLFDSHDVALGDLDRDGDLDAFVANVSDVDNDLSGANKVWFNNGNGVFTPYRSDPSNEQELGSSDSYAVALGDLDGDGDLDAFVANYSQPNKVWINNDGYGTFIDSGQSLGSFNSMDVALGDLDRDGALDAFVANFKGEDKAWLNNGKGIFTEGQSLGGVSSSYGVVIKLIDADIAPDVFVANASNEPNRVWKSDGKGGFIDSEQGMGSSTSLAVALGDLDADDDLDAFVGNYGQANKVWLNNSPPVITDENDKTLTTVTVEMDENIANAFSFTLKASDPEGGTSLKWGFDEALLERDFRTDKGYAYIWGQTGVSKEFYYEPDSNRNGDDSFEVWVSDGVDAASITVYVKINPNVPEIVTDEGVPQESSVTVEMDEDGSPTPFSLTLKASDISDPDGEFLTWRTSSLPRKGTAGTGSTGNTGIITYTPNLDHAGTDRFTVRVSDDIGGYDSITVNVTINEQNDAPVVSQDEVDKLVIWTPAGTERTLTMDDLTADTVTDPDNVFPRDFTLTVQDGENYTRSGNTIKPAEDFLGTLTVPVTVGDGEDENNESNLFYLNITVYLPGDVDASGKVDLGDAILVLQILTGMVLGDDIAIDLNADVDRDRKIGMENANFILQTLSQ